MRAMLVAVIVIPKCVGSHMRCADPECQCGCHGRKSTRTRKPRAERSQASSPSKPSVKRFVLTDKERERIRHEYQTGKTVEILAKENRCRKDLISKIVLDLRMERHRFDHEEARRLYAECGSVRMVARQLHVVEHRVKDALGDMAKQRNALPVSEAEEMRTLFSQGVSVSDISRRTGRDRWTVYGALGKPKQYKKAS